MKLHRMLNHAFRSATALMASFALLAAPAAGAEVSYPTRPGRLIVPFGAGAATDIIARMVAARFSEHWGQQLVIDNRAGSGGIVGTEIAARAAPDGYTIFVYGINQTITPALYSKLSYDPLRDFTLISLYGTLPNVLVVHPSVQAKSVNEFIALARANPGKLQYVSSGIGASPHLTMELLKTTAKIDLLHVPYKVAAQGITDLIGGQMQAMFSNLPSQVGNIKAGRLRPLAVTAAKRAGQIPDVPTMIESGFPGFEVTVWQGFAVPVKTPQAIVDRIHTAMTKALSAPDLQQRLFDQGFTAVSTTPAEFLAFAKSERARWAKVVKDSGTAIE